MVTLLSPSRSDVLGHAARPEALSLSKGWSMLDGKEGYRLEPIKKP